MTTSELARDVFSIVEKKIRSTPSSFEFEMAYQSRVAIDKLRFAITHIERLGSNAIALSEVNYQLLDALDRPRSPQSVVFNGAGEVVCSTQQTTEKAQLPGQ
jgi:hypothetical protein